MSVMYNSKITIFKLKGALPCGRAPFMVLSRALSELLPELSASHAISLSEVFHELSEIAVLNVLSSLLTELAEE